MIVLGRAQRPTVCDAPHSPCWLVFATEDPLSGANLAGSGPCLTWCAGQALKAATDLWLEDELRPVAYRPTRRLASLAMHSLLAGIPAMSTLQQEFLSRGRVRTEFSTESHRVRGWLMRALRTTAWQLYTGDIDCDRTATATQSASASMHPPSLSFNDQIFDREQNPRTHAVPALHRMGARAKRNSAVRIQAASNPVKPATPNDADVLEDTDDCTARVFNCRAGLRGRALKQAWGVGCIRNGKKQGARPLGPRDPTAIRIIAPHAPRILWLRGSPLMGGNKGEAKRMKAGQLPATPG